MKRAATAIPVILLAMALGSPVRGDDTDILYSGAVQPNIVIMFDTSSSMNDNYLGCTSSCQSKWTTAKSILATLVTNLNGVRLGLMTFKSHGAMMQAPAGTSKATILSRIAALSTTSVGTPLGDSMYDVGRYYKGLYPGYASPIQYECQKNFVILITDGLPNQDNRDPVSNESLAMYTTDASAAFPGIQNVKTWTIGLDALAAGTLLQTTATNGGGEYFAADSEAAMELALTRAFDEIMLDSFASFTQPRIPSTEISGSNRTYVASFQTRSAPEWKGALRAYTKSSSGTVPLDVNGEPLASAMVWDAASLLAGTSPASRTIYTYLGTTRQSFDKTNANITTALLGVSSSAERDKVIDFIRGVDAYDEDQDGTRTDDRPFKLGDILHSTPVLIFPPPRDPAADSTFETFRLAQAGRRSILLAGANDGMLHAFAEDTGQELWAFVPPDTFGALKNITASLGAHQFYVDGSPVAGDVKTGGAWRTIAIFGERRGGRYYRALDVTDTVNPSHLWAFTDARIGETWSVPVIGKVKMSDGTDKYVAFAGGGYDTASNNNSGKVFYVIDLATGTTLWQYYNNNTADARYMNFSLAGPPTVVDLDQNGYVDRVYIGDVGGQLWKFDLSAPATVSGGLVTNWTGKRLFVASPSQANPPASGAYLPAQAIYGAPAVANDTSGNLWIYFGTGDRNNPNSAASNRFYGILENTNMTNGTQLTESSLVDVTSADATATQGWFFRLGSDEKNLDSAEVFNGLVLFTTYTPLTTSACGSSLGSARLYAVQQATGYAGMDWSTGQVLTSSSSSQPRSDTIGQGIPSEPTVVMNGSTATVVTGLTTQEIDQTNVPAAVGVRIIYWREVF